MIKTDDKMPYRLVILESFVAQPPQNDYARGYLACLMDECAEDMDDAGSDTFDRALKLVDDIHRSTLMRRRALTLA